MSICSYVYIINIYYSPSKKMLGWCQLLDLPVIPPVSQAPFVTMQIAFSHIFPKKKPTQNHHVPSFSIIFPWFSLIFHHFPMVFHHFPMVFPHFPSFSHCFPSFSIIFPRFWSFFLPMSPQMSRSFRRSLWGVQENVDCEIYGGRRPCEARSFPFFSRQLPSRQVTRWWIFHHFYWVNRWN